MYKLHLLLITVLLTVLSCSRERFTITDEFDPIGLTAGVTDTLLIDDLFYAPDHRIELGQSPELAVQYLPEQGAVVLTADSSFQGATYFNFKYRKKSYYIPVNVKKKQHLLLSYPSRKPGLKVRVIGSFNDWNRNSPFMEYNTVKKRYERHLALDAGRYEYRFQVNGREVLDPGNKRKILNPFGEYNSVLSVPALKARYALYYDSHSKKRDNIITSFRIHEEGKVKRKPRRVFVIFNKQLLDTSNYILGSDRLQVLLRKKQFPGRSTMWVALQFRNGGSEFKKVRFVDGEVAGLKKHPFDWNDAVIYSLFVDRFADGDPSNNKKVIHKGLSDKVNFMGGDLQGLLQKIEAGYFNDLGVNVLWISPLNQNPRDAWQEYLEPRRWYSGYHGYWPVLPRAVDERFGSTDLLKEVTAAAHKHGLKVILDFVSNHVHKNHPYYVEHPEWFGKLRLPDGSLNLRQWDAHRLTTWFEPFLPSFDYQGSPQALEQVTEDAIWWLQTFDLDGFRQDAVKHVPNTFWRTLTRKIKERINPGRETPLFQIGESFGSYDLIASYVNNGQLDAQFDFPLYDVAIPTFTEKEGDFRDLNLEIMKGLSVFGMDHKMGNLMDSHDKVRFMALAEHDIPRGADAAEIGWTKPPRVDDPRSYKKARLYMMYMLTIPGIPVLYYGDEIGMTGAADPDNRRMMRFDDKLSKEERQHLKNVSKLVKMRTDHSALRYGDFRPLYVTKDVYAYLRTDLRERLLVILNKSDKEQVVTLEFPGDITINSVIAMYNAKKYSLLTPVLEVTIGPYQGQVLLLK